MNDFKKNQEVALTNLGKITYMFSCSLNQALMLYRILYCCVLTCLFIGAESCKSSYPDTAEVVYKGTSTKGVITLDAKGYGRTEKEALHDAYKTAFNTIFFVGLPQYSPLSRPMISKGSSVQSDYKSYFQRFYDEKGYMTFVVSQGKTGSLSKANDRKNKYLRHTFSVNMDALKRDLEENGIIRKFGL